MTSALLVAGIASLLLAASLIMMAWRHVRESRARVTALRQFALGDEPAADHDVFRPVEGTPVAAAVAPTSPSMFAAVDEPAPPARRWMSLAAVAAVMLVILATLFLLQDPVAAPAPANVDASIGASDRAPVPLELTALRHDIDRRGLLTITGRVLNPSQGRPLEHLVTVITAFDAEGRRVATEESAVEAEILAPDARAAFSATVSDARSVARYDVTFRLRSGAPVGHVDRR